MSTLQVLAMYYRIQMQQARSAEQLINRAASITQAAQGRLGEFKVGGSKLEVPAYSLAQMLVPHQVPKLALALFPVVLTWYFQLSEVVFVANNPNPQVNIIPSIILRRTAASPM